VARTLNKEREEALTNSHITAAARQKTNIFLGKCKKNSLDPIS
jgi:hypothetical protein